MPQLFEWNVPDVIRHKGTECRQHNGCSPSFFLTSFNTTYKCLHCGGIFQYVQQYLLPNFLPLGSHFSMNGYFASHLDYFHCMYHLGKNVRAGFLPGKQLQNKKSALMIFPLLKLFMNQILDELYNDNNKLHSSKCKNDQMV